MPVEDNNPRRRPCHVLRRYGVPSVVWFEDALEAYGVPTMLFDLYLLVPDIEIAADVLEQNGWKPIPQQLGRIGNALVDLHLHPQLRLAPPDEDCASHRSASLTPSGRRLPPIGYGPPTIVLLSAAEWNFNFEKNNRPTAFLPSLENLLDGLLDSLLDCSEQRLQDHLDVQLAYLYGNAPELKERAFAERLVYEHRQYHFDIMSGMNFGTVPFVRHQREVRKALREGTFQLQECSAARDNEDLFNRGVQARLLASLPRVFDEDSEAVEEIG